MVTVKSTEASSLKTQFTVAKVFTVNSPSVSVSFVYEAVNEDGGGVVLSAPTPNFKLEIVPFEECSEVIVEESVR